MDALSHYGMWHTWRQEKEEHFDFLALVEDMQHLILGMLDPHTRHAFAMTSKTRLAQMTQEAAMLNEAFYMGWQAAPRYLNFFWNKQDMIDEKRFVGLFVGLCHRGNEAVFLVNLQQARDVLDVAGRPCCYWLWQALYRGNQRHLIDLVRTQGMPHEDITSLETRFRWILQPDYHAGRIDPDIALLYDTFMRPEAIKSIVERAGEHGLRIVRTRETRFSTADSTRPPRFFANTPRAVSLLHACINTRHLDTLLACCQAYPGLTETFHKDIDVASLSRFYDHLINLLGQQALVDADFVHTLGHLRLTQYLSAIPLPFPREAVLSLNVSRILANSRAFGGVLSSLTDTECTTLVTLLEEFFPYLLTAK